MLFKDLYFNVDHEWCIIYFKNKRLRKLEMNGKYLTQPNFT